MRYKSLNRAIARGHVIIFEGSKGVELFRRVKSNKSGAGGHSRWVKGIRAFSKVGEKFTKY